MKENKSLWLEFVVLFILVPASLASPISIYLKLGSVVLALGFVGYTVWENKWVKKDPMLRLAEKEDHKRIGVMFLLLAVISIPIVHLFYPELLFIVVKTKPLLWVFILFVYAIFSVYPQELIYRSFYIKKYEVLFEGWNHWAIVLLNAIIFALAHLFLWNGLVLLLTFVGGCLFMHTYLKTRSIMTTSIEHALYGLWIFTLGLGEMLAFPV